MLSSAELLDKPCAARTAAAACHAAAELVEGRAALAAADVYLLPGQLWSGNEARSVTTLLGSCCAITLWHPRYRHAAMCHYLLPRRDGVESSEPIDAALDARYGDEAIALLRAAVERFGAPLAGYHARVYGGANMFAAFGKSTLDIGARNAELARTELARHGIVPLSVDVRGTAYRRLRMTPANGVVTVHHGQ